MVVKMNSQKSSKNFCSNFDDFAKLKKFRKKKWNFRVKKLKILILIFFVKFFLWKKLSGLPSKTLPFELIFSKNRFFSLSAFLSKWLLANLFFFVRRVQVFGGKKCVGAISIDESFSNRLKFSEFLQKTILRENGFGSTKIFYEENVSTYRNCQTKSQG